MVSMATMGPFQVITSPTHCVGHTLDLVRSRLSQGGRTEMLKSSGPLVNWIWGTKCLPELGGVAHSLWLVVVHPVLKTSILVSG